MKKIMAVILSMLLAGVLLAKDTENDVSEAKYYDNAKVIRIKNVEGEGFVQRSYEEGYEEATPNLPLFEKDTVGTTAGRLGIYLGRLNYLRLDSETTVELLGIPQLRKTDLIVRVEKGAIYLDIENLDNEKSIEVQTPDCGVFLLDKGIYRINVDENSLTEVFVMEGSAEVAGQENSSNVRGNQKIVMSRGNLEKRPYYFYASEKDAFDRWNETQTREQGYARTGTSRYLQSGYEDYEYEMSRSGRWSYMSDFNSYVWIPYYSNTDWLPYANGRWVWNPHYGYVWTSYDNCGWFTHHYGRWHWGYASGWYWIPGYHWSPAWVSWFGDNDYYGWCPLSWWNRPIFVINNRWDHHYNYRHGMPHQARSTIIIRKGELTAANMQRVAMKKNNFGLTGAKDIAYRGTAPGERLALAKVQVINANGKTVSYKQNGIVSAEKYKITNEAGQISHGGAIKAAVYKYNPSSDINGKYSPRISNSRSDDKTIENGSKKYPAGNYRSMDDEKDVATSTSKPFRSSSSGDKSQPKTTVSGNSNSGAKSSSSTNSSSNAAKKKKDEAAYMALLQSENSAGFKSHALGMANTSSGYASSDGSNNPYSYRSYESKNRDGYRSADTYSPVSSSRYSSSRQAVSANSGFSNTRYPSRSNPANGGFPLAGPPRSTLYTEYELKKEQNYYNNSSYRNNNSSRNDNGGNFNSSYSPGSGNSPYRSDHSSQGMASAPGHSSARVMASSQPQSSSSSMATHAKKKN